MTDNKWLKNPPSWGELLKGKNTSTRDLARYILQHLKGYRKNAAAWNVLEDLTDMEMYLHSYHSSQVQPPLVGRIYHLKEPAPKYMCDGFPFDNYDNALAHASKVFRETGVVCAIVAIEEVNKNDGV